MSDITNDNTNKDTKEDNVIEEILLFAELMNCDYKTAYERYTQELFNLCISWIENRKIY